MFDNLTAVVALSLLALICLGLAFWITRDGKTKKRVAAASHVQREAPSPSKLLPPLTAAADAEGASRR